jgi:hypothetical protein
LSFEYPDRINPSFIQTAFATDFASQHSRRQVDGNQKGNEESSEEVHHTTLAALVRKGQDGFHQARPRSLQEGREADRRRDGLEESLA